MKYFIAALLLAFFLPAPAQAQSAYDKMYMEMVEKAKTMPPDFDFRMLRGAYVRSSFYDPYGETAYKTKLFNLLDRAKAGDRAALKDANMMAEQYFASYKIHSYMATSEVLTTIQINFHEWALKGIAASMIGTDDASSFEKAIKVIDVGEEYFLVRTYLKGKAQTRQSVQQKDGRVYDVIHYTDEKGEAREAYFDVTIPFSRYPVTEEKKQAAPAPTPAPATAP